MFYLNAERKIEDIEKDRLINAAANEGYGVQDIELWRVRYPAKKKDHYPSSRVTYIPARIEYKYTLKDGAVKRSTKDVEHMNKIFFDKGYQVNFVNRAPSQCCLIM